MGIVGTSLNLGARPNESNEDLERTLGRSRSWMPHGILGDWNTDRKAGICLRCHHLSLLVVNSNVLKISSLISFILTLIHINIVRLGYIILPGIILIFSIAISG